MVIARGVGPDQSETGQALIEGVTGIALIAGFLALSIPLLISNWNSFRCAHAVFEQTHQALIGLPTKSRRFDRNSAVKITEDEDWVTGEAFCEGGREVVRLRKL